VSQAAASLDQSLLLPPPSSTAFDRALNATVPRSDWTKEEISEIHQKPLMELVFAAVRAPLVDSYNRVLHIYLPSLLLSNSLRSGIPPSSFPQAICGPTLHVNEYQDRGLHRRLFVLRPVVPLFHRP